MHGLDLCIRAQHHSALHHVFQLAHIARPRVSQQQGLCFSAHAEHRFFGVPQQQLGNQWQDVTWAVPQSRYAQLEGADAEVQVFTKLPRANGLAQIFVGRRDHAHIHGHRPFSPQPGELALLQNAQQLGLQVHGHFANLI